MADRNPNEIAAGMAGKPLVGAQLLAIDEIVTVVDGRQFRVLQMLGEGLTAEVYRARRVDGDQQVALKVLKPDLAPEFRQSFMDEADTLSLLRAAERQAADGLTLIPEVITRPRGQDSPPVLVMELVESQSVLDLLETRGPLSEMTVLTIADQVLRVLHLLHTELHKSYTDFQLRNIRWQEDRQQIKLIDWNHVSRTAPEGKQPAGVPADLVRVGAYLYQMLTGKGAFQTGEPAGALAARAGEQWTAKVSTGTRFIVERALHPNPERRFPTAAAFRDAIREQIDLWNRDEDDLDDEATGLVREVRNEERRRDPAQLRRAAVLADVFHRRRPSARSVQWREEIAGYTDQISPAWGSGRQYFRAELYSKAVELWAEEVLAWQRPDLWRWLVVARQAASDPAAFTPTVAQYEDVVSLMAEGHWQEVRQRLAVLGRGQVDDLAIEATVHETVAAAEADERAQPPRAVEAAAGYRKAAKLLDGMREAGYRAAIQDVYGWAALEARALDAERRGRQLASDTQKVETLRRQPKTASALLTGIVAALRDNPVNLALFDFIVERAADEALEPERRKELVLAALEFGNPSPVMRDRLESLRDKAQLQIYSRSVDELRTWPKASGELLTGLTAALAAYPKNVALYDFALQLAEDGALEPERRIDFVEAALRGAPPEALRGRLQAAATGAQSEIDARLAAERQAEEERLRKEKAAEEAQRRQEEAAQATQRQKEEAEKAERDRQAQEAEAERQRQAELAQKQAEEAYQEELHRLKMAKQAAELRRAQELADQTAAQRRTEDRLEMERALTAGDWSRLALLVAAQRDNVPDDLPRQAEKEFKAALGRKDAARARLFGVILDQVDAPNRDKRLQQIDQLSLSQDELMKKLANVRALLAAATAELKLDPPNYERAADAHRQAENALEGLTKEQNGKWAGLLPSTVLAGLQNELRAVGQAIQRGAGDGGEPQRQDWRTWLSGLGRRYWPVLATAILFFLGGFGLGFLLAGDPMPPDPTPTLIAEITPEPTDDGGLIPLEDTPTATATPETPTATPIITSTVNLEPTATPETPTVEPTLPPADIGVSGDDNPRLATGEYFDLPDLDLTAPDGSTFDWSSGELRWSDPLAPEGWQVVLIVTDEAGAVVQQGPVPAAVVELSPVDGSTTAAPPTPPTSGTAIRLKWSLQPESTPLLPANYFLNLVLRSDTGQERAISAFPQPTSFVVAAPVQLTILAGNTYRRLPIMARDCLIGRELDPLATPTNPQLEVEAIGMFEDEGDLFYQIRLPSTPSTPSTRQTFWLADSAARTADGKTWEELASLLPKIEMEMDLPDKCGPVTTKPEPTTQS